MATDAIQVLDGEHADVQALFGRVSSPDEDRREVLKELMRTVAAHIAAEKQALLPALRDLHDGDLADRLAEDHHRMEKAMTLLERRKANSPDAPDLVEELLAAWDDHTAACRAEVFPGLRAAYDAEALDRLGQELQDDENRRLTHAHPGVPDRGPLAAVARKAAEVVDKVRDRSTDINRSGS